MLHKSFRGVLKRIFKSVGLIASIRSVVLPFRPSFRSQQVEARAEFSAFLNGSNPARQLDPASHPYKRSALVVGYANPSFATLQTPLIIALRVAGYRVTVLLDDAKCASADFYLKVGAVEVFDTGTIPVRIRRAQSRRMIASLTSMHELLTLDEEGISVGKFTASTLMRKLRCGSIDPTKSCIHEDLLDALTESREAAMIAKAVVAKTSPDLVCFYDRGYTPDGQLFEAALASGAKAITLNTAHKGGSFLLKCYGLHNKNVHPGMPSPEFWRYLRTMSWTTEHWSELRSELEGCYSAGRWYDEVGTQMNTNMHDSSDLIQRLRLDPEKPIAVIFPHLFWDATFFWGEDLFSDYEEWFIETIKGAAANPSLNWIIKIHPANIVKNRRDNYTGEYSEVTAIREALGALPPHIKLLMPESPVSTFSLIGLMDYCLTVRGTVGLEAAVFGKLVLTAGTGRYDHFGFTLDSKTTEEYLQRISKLHTLPLPDNEHVELARRYAYGLFICRSLEASCISFEYGRDASATLRTNLNLPKGVPVDQLPDISLLADWLSDPGEADLVVKPSQ